MPMNEFRYKREKITDAQAEVIGRGLEDAVRSAIAQVRDSLGYGVTTEGDPFGPIAHNQPDLRIYVFYHQEWEFSEDELAALAAHMKISVSKLLQQAKVTADIMGKIRFYARSGHFSASF